MELFRILGKVVIDKADAIKALDEVASEGQEAEKKLSSAFRTIGEGSVTMGKNLGVASAAATGLLGGMVSSAANAKALDSQFAQTFAGVEEQASSAMQSVAASSGIIETRLKGVGTSIFAFAKTTGMDTPEALGMMERALQVTADSAAYYDRSLEDTSESLKSFLKGNYENDAALGLSCTETTRNAAANKLYGKSFNELSEAQKQLTLLQMVEDANALSGALGQASRESDGWENVTGNLKASLTQLGASLGEVILPAVTTGVQKLTDFIEKLSGMGTAGKVVVIAFTALIAVASPLLITVGMLCNGIGSMIDLFGKLTKKQAENTAATAANATAQEMAATAADKSRAALYGTKNAANSTTKALYGSAVATETSRLATLKDTIAKKLNGSAAATAATKVLAFAAAHKVALIATLGLAAPIIALAMYMGKTGASAEEVAAKITSFADNLAGMITQFAQAFPSMIDSLVSSLTTVIDAIVAQLPTLIPLLINAGLQLFMALVNSLTQIIQPLVAALPTVINAVVQALPVLIPALLEAAITLFMALVDAIPIIIESLVTALPMIIDAFVQALPVLITSLIEAAVTLFMALVEAIPLIIPPLIAALPKIIEAFVQALPMLIEALLAASVQLFTAIVQAIPVIIPALISALWQIIKTIGSTLLSGLNTAWNSIKQGAANGWEKLKTTITSKIEAVKTKVSSVVEGIKTKLAGVWDNIKTTASNAWNRVKEAISKPITAAKEKVQEMMDKVKSFFPLKIGKIFDNLKIPKITVSGGKAPFGIAGKGKLPSFDVQWNAKGAIFDEPTIFATAQGLQGVGEAGKEAVAPIDTLQQYVASAVASQNGEMVEVLQAILYAIKNMDAGLYQKFESALDNRKIQWNDRELGRFVKNYA